MMLAFHGFRLLMLHVTLAQSTGPSVSSKFTSNAPGSRARSHFQAYPSASARECRPSGRSSFHQSYGACEPASFRLDPVLHYNLGASGRGGMEVLFWLTDLMPTIIGCVALLIERRRLAG